jgi:hypothetical protein
MAIVAINEMLSCRQSIWLFDSQGIDLVSNEMTFGRYARRHSAMHGTSNSTTIGNDDHANGFPRFTVLLHSCGTGLRERLRNGGVVSSRGRHSHATERGKSRAKAPCGGSCASRRQQHAGLSADRPANTPARSSRVSHSPAARRSERCDPRRRTLIKSGRYV